MTVGRHGFRLAAETRAFLGLAGSFWRGRASWTSWGSLLVAAVFVALQTHAQVALNDWSRRFFDVLAAHGTADAASLPAALLPLAALYVTAVTGMVVSRMTIQWHWRRHVTRSLMARWFDRNGFLRVETAAEPVATAESRIVDDVRASVEPLGDLGIGLASNLSSAAAFSFILANVGGSLDVPFAGRTVSIPAYMLVVTLAYAAIISALTWITGRRLIPLSRWRNDAEARLRAALGRTRENAESVALAGGANAEARRAEGFLAGLGQAWRAVIGQNGRLGLALNLNGALFTTVPLMFAAPKALAGALTVGEVAQLIAAFTAVQGALLWAVDNFVKLADCRAAATRVGALALALDRTAPLNGSAPAMASGPDDGAVLSVTNFRPAAARPASECAPLTFRLQAGESILLTGPSGIGKTSMLRAIAGLSQPGSGTCAVSGHARLAIVPQKPYVPVGPLRDAVCFPRVDRDGDEAVATALVRCGLASLRDSLDSDKDWDRSLSIGERQRLAFANLLLRDLDLILLDEATSALDEVSQALLMNELRRSKPGCAILSIGHRPSLVPLHDRVVTLTPEAPRGAPAAAWSLAGDRAGTSSQGAAPWQGERPAADSLTDILRSCVLASSESLFERIVKML